MFLQYSFVLFSTVIFLLFSSCIHKADLAYTQTANRNVSTDETSLILIGQVPGEYLQKNKNQFYLAAVEMKNRVIQNIVPLGDNDVQNYVRRRANDNVLILKQQGAQTYDAIYPGLLNLHNHTKQNVLSTWSAAKGQFQNRFEWRGWGNYTKSVSQNMNPWIGFGKAMNCAAFRWSNLQNMINGTTYLQGPSSCINGFGIYKVEDSKAYVSSKEAVQGPTDLVYPNEMIYVWDVLKPLIEAGKTYEQALLADVKRHCAGPEIDKINEQNFNSTASLKILSTKKILEASCTKDTASLHPKFIRYIYFIHKSIAGKKEYLKSPNRSAIIAHLSEGRRLDPYNQLEYKLIKLLGLNQPNVNFIHGVGITNEDFKDMAANKMGLIWSPYSNLLLYGETLDIVAAHEAGVKISIGSDWVPTGTKSVLEEIKLAAQYVDRNKINNIFNDEYLYKMMTENSAKMINHWEISNTEAGVGRLAIGAMGSVIVASVLNPNPYTNLVRNVTERDINLVVVDNKAVYGNTDYLDTLKTGPYEIFSNEIQNADRLTSDSSIPKATEQDLKDKAKSFVDCQIMVDGPEKDNCIAKSQTVLKCSEIEDAEEKEDCLSDAKELPYLNKMATAASKARLNRQDLCQFKIAKAFVTPNTKAIESTIGGFQRKTNLDLDRVTDIQQLLAVSLMTQSLNRMNPKGDPKFAASYFPNLYTCNSPQHLARIQGYVRTDGNDELKSNLENRATLRKGLGAIPKKLAESYKQIYQEK
jgi:hypothetical protein